MSKAQTIEQKIRGMSSEDLDNLCAEVEFRLSNGNLNSITKTTLNAMLEYGKLTILSRAFPRVEDGLKPVHRRILYGMHELKLTPTSPHKKCARIVGNVIGLYHPHGDKSVYDAMARMSQDFSLNVPLIDWQGNNGSLEGDNPASMRYTEAKVTKSGANFFSDLDKSVVEMIANYDETMEEPEVLPVKYPNLLVNGTSGIAVGMSSKLPPHNPAEVINATKYMISTRVDKIDYNQDELLKIIPGPDFPTNGILYNTSNMKDIAETGKGKLKLRARHYVETVGKVQQIVITEIPFLTKITSIFDKLKEITNNRDNKKQYEYFASSISEVMNKTSRDGIKIVIKLKQKVDGDIMWNKLVKTVDTLDSTVSYLPNFINEDGMPESMNIKRMIEAFLDFRIKVLNNKYNYIKKQKVDQLELVVGYIRALNMIDELIAYIRNSESDELAKNDIIHIYDYTERQASAIMNMRLSRLSKMEDGKLHAEKDELEAVIKKCDRLLNSDKLKYNEISKDLDDYIKTLKDSSRKTEIDNSLGAITHESLISNEECIVYLSKIGYVRREAIKNVSKQNRGTKGKKKMDLTDSDFIIQTFETNSHSTLLLFTNKGNVFGIKAYDIPDYSRGRHVAQLFEISEDENIIKVIEVKDMDDDIHITMGTKDGIIKKSELSQYKGALRKRGIGGIRLVQDDEVRFVSLTTDNQECMIINSSGKVIRFDISQVSLMGRGTKGVRAMRLNGAEVLNGICAEVTDETTLLTITEKGTMKASLVKEYNKQRRGGVGVIAMTTNTKTGKVLKPMILESMSNDLVMTTKEGITNRIHLDELKKQSRKTVGVKAMSLSKSDIIVDALITQKEMDAEASEITELADSTKYF